MHGIFSAFQGVSARCVFVYKVDETAGEEFRLEFSDVQVEARPVAAFPDW